MLGYLMFSFIIESGERFALAQTYDDVIRLLVETSR